MNTASVNICLIINFYYDALMLAHALLASVAALSLFRDSFSDVFVDIEDIS